MRIAILTQDDGVFSFDFLKPFLTEIAKNSELHLTSINLSRSSSVGRKQNLAGKFIQITDTFGFLFLINSIGRFFYNRLARRTLKNLAQEFRVDIFDCRNTVNSGEFREKLVSEKVNLVIIVAGSEIIKKELLQVPKYGFINCHSSLLPSNKGLMPVFWSLLSGNTGFTWYSLDEGVDTGKVLYQKRIATQDSFVKQLIYTKEMAAARLSEAIDVILGNRSQHYEEDIEESYNRFPHRRDVDKLRKIVRLF